MVLVVGVDGCPGGWLAIGYDLERAKSFTLLVHRTFQELLTAWVDAAVIALDIPIGLVEGEARLCDRAARRLLGARGSSVFPAPDPRVVMIEDYEEAKSRFRDLEGKGITKQAFGIFAKAAEVDAIMTPAMQGRVIEVHPEVSFWALAGKVPMMCKKKRVAGFNERRNALIGAFPEGAVPRRDQVGPMVRAAYLEAGLSVKRRAAADDVLDAIVAAWTAGRHTRGESKRVSDVRQLGARGLQADIVY